MSEEEVNRLEVHAAKKGKSLSQFLGPLMLLAAATFLEENPIDLKPKAKSQDLKVAEMSRTPHKFVSSTKLPAQFCAECELERKDRIHNVAPAARTPQPIPHGVKLDEPVKEDKAGDPGALVAHFNGRKPQPRRQRAAAKQLSIIEGDQWR